MLGTTVPEPNSDQRVFVCSAGVSEELGQLIRVYPLSRRHAPKRWSVHRVKLERNPRDSRSESFQIAGDRRPGIHWWINHRFEPTKVEVPRRRRAQLLSRRVIGQHLVGSIDEANARRLSLAIIHPRSLEVTFSENSSGSPSTELTLFDSMEPEKRGAQAFPLMPRIRFQDSDREHHLMLRDWGSFELQRKMGPDYFRENLQSALHLSNDSSLLIGNLNNQRTAWLVISILNGLREPATLFDVESDDMDTLLHREVCARDNWACIACGSTREIVVKRRPWRSATEDKSTIADYHTLCGDCVRGARIDT
jgi:hypothetical protein